jgi:hypothetical protein
MPSYVNGSGIFVSERVADSADVERALNRIDHPIAHRLFVTREIDRYFRAYVWRVLVDNGDRPAECVTEWRDGKGMPLELSHGLVEKVKAQIAGGFDVDRILRANDLNRERLQAEASEALREIADDVGPRISETRSPLFHRGPHLRRSRAKRLSSGEDARRKRFADRLFSGEEE